MRRLVPSPVFLAVLLAGWAMLASCSTASAGFVPVNSDELGTANLNPDDVQGMTPSSGAVDRQEKDDPLLPSNDQKGPRLGRDLLSLLGSAGGRNQTGGAGSPSNSHDSGGSGQAFVLAISSLINSPPAPGGTVIDLDCSFSDALTSRLFRPPRAN